MALDASGGGRKIGTSAGKAQGGEKGEVSPLQKK